MNDVYVVSCCRTAIGAFGGSLKDVPASALGAVVVKNALLRAGAEAEHVDEVYIGCVLNGGLGQNVARQIALKAGIPVEVPATTIGMVCGSGMKAVIDGMRAIRCGDADIVVVGGAENMSAAPYLFPSGRWGARMGESKMVDSMIRDGLWDAINDYHMGVTAENIVEHWALTREELDAFALSSQQKAKKAIDSNRFQDEIVPVEIVGKKQTTSFCKDEYPKETSIEALARLRPAFKANGTVTAGNSSGINDGAAALVLASDSAVKKHGLEAMAKITGWGQAGVDPSIMGIGPVAASRKAMQRAGVTVDDLNFIEANEAFAAQAIAVARELSFNCDKVNVNGGAIALGHPIGASGARIIVTLLHEMLRQPGPAKGLATLCIGGGMGISTIFEKV